MPQPHVLLRPDLKQALEAHTAEMKKCGQRVLISDCVAEAVEIYLDCTAPAHLDAARRHAKAMRTKRR